MDATLLPPDTINQSPVLVSRALNRNGHEHGLVVICDQGLRAAKPFITWELDAEPDGQTWRPTATGRSFRTLVEAHADLMAYAA